MKVFIINFNRVTLTKQMAEWAADHGCQPVFVDNGSRYKPLLEYYEKCGFPIVWLKDNYGHRGIWQKDIISLFGITGRYIVTDPDLDLSEIPSDWLQVLHMGLDRHKGFNKCGFSLEINDIPDIPENRYVIERWENRYWTKPLDNMYFDAPTDTTFAMYREEVNRYFTSPSMRTNRPYVAKHIPWYYLGMHGLPEDEQHYFRTANSSCTIKTKMLK